MHSENQIIAGSRVQLWTGRILTGLAALFFLFDGVMKLVKPQFVVDATAAKPQ